jgi:flavin reductase (DIM6/NTAB) family NADH-FMN oxidoreductase RutF
MTGVTDVFHQLVDGIDYPMYVVTAADGDERAGCLVGFTTQASIDPPRLLVLLSKQNETYRIALRSDVLVAHFLGEDNRDLAALFGEQSGDWTDKFTKCTWHEGPSGVPVLEDVRGWVAGRVAERYDFGDHVGHLLEPIDAAAGAGRPPLGFQQVRELDPGHPA